VIEKGLIPMCRKFIQELKFMPKDVSKEKSINKAKTTFELVVCAVIIGTSVFLGKSCFDKVKVVPSTN
jgi:hypothetical protein